MRVQAPTEDAASDIANFIPANQVLRDGEVDEVLIDWINSVEYVGTTNNVSYHVGG